jgi:alpha-glucosidase
LQGKDHRFMIVQPLTNARLAGRAGATWRFTCDQGAITLAFVTPEIARIAFMPTDSPPHLTWAVVPEVADLPAPAVTVTEQADGITLRTGALVLTATLGARLALALARADGSAILADAPEGGLGYDGGGHPAWATALAAGERVSGGGQRTGPLDQRGRTLTHWATDPLPHHSPEQTDAMYQSASFFVMQRDGRAHGIFYDAAHRSTIDIGKTAPDVLHFATEGPDLVAYVCAGPTLADVLRQYTTLTGRIPPVPRWSLGNQQSRWSYLSADEVRAVAARFREERIPCDAIYLDIDYMDGYRDFTFNPATFPDPAGLIAELRAQGFRLVPIIDPGVKVDSAYPVYQEGMARGYFVRNPDGSVFEGWVWPGRSVWVDFARAEARAWWGEQHRGLIAMGVAGIWDDMNEPSQAGMSAPPEVTVPFGATLPLNAVHDSTEYGPQSHAACHNAYGHEMAHATRAALEAARPGERAFVLTRAAQAGTQRYAAVWNGDNTSMWPHVRQAITMNLGLGLSGFPITGGDIGGFWGDTTPELLVRFTQLGALLPFCRNHSSKGTARQEPWVFGEPYTSVIREALALRYRLLPLLVTLAHEAAATGAPLMRPLAWIAPDDPASRACDDQFLLGNDLLIAPVLEEGATARAVVLPPGTWFAWETGAAHAGGQTITLPVALETIPLFTRTGGIIPVAGDIQHTGEEPAEPLTLEIFLAAPGQTARATIWDDDDHPHAAQRGTYAEYAATAAWDGDSITVRVTQAGGWMPPRYPGVAVALHLPESYIVENDGLAEGNLHALPLTWRFAVTPAGV